MCSGGLRLGSSINLETWYLFLNSEWSRVRGGFQLAWLPRDQFMSWANLFIFNEKQSCWRGRNVGVSTWSPGRKCAGKLYGLFGEEYIWEEEAKHLEVLRNPLPVAEHPLQPGGRLESVVDPLTFSWAELGQNSQFFPLSFLFVLFCFFFPYSTMTLPFWWRPSFITHGNTIWCY